MNQLLQLCPWDAKRWRLSEMFHSCHLSLKIAAALPSWLLPKESAWHRAWRAWVLLQPHPTALVPVLCYSECPLQVSSTLAAKEKEFQEETGCVFSTYWPSIC